jgi:hypothetical protein
MRIDAFLRESPMFAVLHAARRLDALANDALAEDNLSFAGGLILTSILSEEPRPIKPSQLADTFGTTRGNQPQALVSGSERVSAAQNRSTRLQGPPR